MGKVYILSAFLKVPWGAKSTLKTWDPTKLCKKIRNIFNNQIATIWT